MDFPIREGEDSAECVYDGLYYTVCVVDEGFLELQEYDVSGSNLAGAKKK